MNIKLNSRRALFYLLMPILFVLAFRGFSAAVCAASAHEAWA
nr:hypothetical protein [Rhodoferax sp.]